MQSTRNHYLGIIGNFTMATGDIRRNQYSCDDDCFERNGTKIVIDFPSYDSYISLVYEMKYIWCCRDSFFYDATLT
jgi:hypothetical protein